MDVSQPYRARMAQIRDLPAAERAYVLTKELVLSGQLQGGHLLSEGDIAARLGVSRTPVREAFLRLESEKLLRLIPRRGAVVVPVQSGEAEDVLDAREAVEGAAVRRLLGGSARLPAAIDALREVLETQGRAANRGDVDTFAEADEAFHRSIVAAEGNALLTRFYAGFADRQRRMSVHVLGPVPEQLPVILRQHKELVAVLDPRDEAGFAATLRAHLDGTHRR
jgi:DNA-binding GntR family transcriptional regulator